MSEEELILGIQTGGMDRDHALRYIYTSNSYNGSVKKVLKNMGSSIEQSNEIYNEAIIILDRNIRLNKFKAESTLLSYFVSIAKWQYLALKRKSTRQGNVPLEEENIKAISYNPIEQMYSDESQKNKIQWIMQKASAKCKELFRLYMQNMDYVEMALTLGHSNSNSSKNALYRCREKLREEIKKSFQS